MCIYALLARVANGKNWQVAAPEKPWLTLRGPKLPGIADRRGGREANLVRWHRGRSPLRPELHCE